MQVEMLVRINEIGEFVDNQVWETPIPHIQGRVELGTKESDREEA